MRRWVVTVGERELAVEVEQALGGRVRVRVDGRPYELDLCAVLSGGGRALSLLCEGRVYTVDPAAIGARVIDADRHLLAKSRRRALGAAGTAADGVQHVRASIPGKVVRCLVKPGEQVRPGQGLVILEAMKMENELRAVRAGRVRDVAVREGQAVETGETLLVIEG